MDPLLTAAAGTIVMVLALLAFRLHAFLALILGALTVGLLTPRANREWFHIRAASARAIQFNPATGELAPAPKSKPPAEGRVHLLPVKGSPAPLATGAVLVREGRWFFQPAPGSAVVALPPEPMWIVPDAVLSDARKQATTHPMAVVAEGFGAACRSIGLLILLAAVIGRCLTESLAAERIVGWIQGCLGERRAPEGFALSGFLLGIPSFFDTVFYLLMPLGRGLATRTGRDFLLYTLTIVSGATMAHSLVPPTPGPIFTAKEFGVPIGTMMLAGACIGCLTVPCGVLYARWANRRWPLPLRPTLDGAPTPVAPGEGVTLPPLFLAVLPILLPIGLIAVAESWKAFGPADGGGTAGEWIRFLGQNQMALLLGTAAAWLLLIRRHRWKLTATREPVTQALTSGAGILLITAAGGAFGHMIRQTDIAERIASFSGGGGGMTLLVAAFAITTLVRVAQGSATVAMITAAGVVAPIAEGATLPYHPVYLALAIGCGSKPVPWMNDSGFWIIGRMSGMTEVETLRSASVMMSLMGIVGFGAVMAGAKWLPMAAH